MQLLAVAAAVLNQALDLVQNRLTDDSQLSVSAQHLAGSTIGVCDHFSIMNAADTPILARQAPATCP